MFVRQRLQEQPDGSLAAVEGQLWRYDLRSRTSKQLTFDATVKDQVPDWSPNGRWIAYGADNDVWVMRANGSRQRNLTATPEVVECGAAWSPEGKEIAYTGGGPDVPEGERYVQVMCADGGQLRVVVRTPGLAQAVAGWQPLPGGHHTTLTGGTR